MGNSPEPMLLDSLLFGDLIEKITWSVVTMVIRMGEERYTTGTPDEAWRAMLAAWELVSEAWIRQDIGRFRTAA